MATEALESTKKHAKKKGQLVYVYQIQIEGKEKKEAIGFSIWKKWKKLKYEKREKNQKMRQLGLAYEEEKKIKKWGNWVQYMKKRKKSKNEAITSSI